MMLGVGLYKVIKVPPMLQPEFTQQRHSVHLAPFHCFRLMHAPV